MISILKQLSKHWITCIVIFILLVIQANCDLSIPSMTSDIVDTGIQMSGITSNVPDTIRKDSLDALLWLMEEDDAQKVMDAYSLKEDIYTLVCEKNKTLEQAFTIPEMVLVSMASNNKEEVQVKDLDEACKNLLLSIQSFPAGMKDSQIREVLQSTMNSELSKVDESTLDLMESQAKAFVKLEYRAQGIEQKVQLSYLFKVGSKMLGYTLLLVACAILVGLLASRVSAFIGKDLREKVFEKVLSFSNEEIESFSTASLITRTTNDIQQVQMVYVMLLRMVLYAPILGIGGIVKVWNTGSDLSWIIVLTVGMLLGLIALLMVIAMPKFKKVQTLVDHVNQVSREILTGVMPIRAFSREEYEEKRFDKANTELMKNQLFTTRTMAFMMPFMTIIMNGCSLLIVWFGAKSMDMGNMQVGDLIAYITYTMQIVMSFMMIAMVSIMLPRASVAFSRIEEVLNKPLSIQSADKPVEKEFKGEIQFSDVSFTYPDGQDEALTHLNFTMKPGQTTAIVGSTGCGKSTILNLICRFYDVSKGSILLDGVDIRSIPLDQLRDCIGYVGQKGILFSGSIASNIKFGSDISDEKMKEAGQIAQAEEFILSKSEQYNSHIAQSGTNVSGGQKQRISIARAIAKDPLIYLFDDSFSALDFKTDATLRKELSKKTKDKTVLIVAQRISTILHADQILVLDEGRIVGMGNHRELMKSCKEYQEIARSQLSMSELGGIE
ncbi:MAG: ABC transporter ATP-binding protein/permease [Erysipelotrichaceae bacterium]|nr:ABC transporter ATP-binding protein/permease [Erysipelotrichaceae bacterium]